MLVLIPNWLPTPQHHRGRQHVGHTDQRAPIWAA